MGLTIGFKDGFAIGVGDEFRKEGSDGLRVGDVEEMACSSYSIKY